MRVSGTALNFAEVAILTALDVEGVGFVVVALALAIVEDNEHDGEESRTRLSEVKSQKFCECGGPGPRPVVMVLMWPSTRAWRPSLAPDDALYTARICLFRIDLKMRIISFP